MIRLTADEAAENTERIRSEAQEALCAEHIDRRYLAKKLKSELNQRKTEFFKLKGQISQVKKNNLPKGVFVLLSTTEETLVAASISAPDIRQKARQDAHKLLGDYPAEKREHTFPGGIPIQLSSIPKDELPALKAAGEAYVNTLFGPQKD